MVRVYLVGKPAKEAAGERRRRCRLTRGSGSPVQFHSREKCTPFTPWPLLAGALHIRLRALYG